MKRNGHAKALEKMVRHQLVARHFEIAHDSATRTWIEPVFKPSGIYTREENCDFGLDKTITIPDLMFYASRIDSGRIAIVEAKTGEGELQKARMIEQIYTAYQYVLREPENFLNFFVKHGVSEEEVENSTICFLGVGTTHKGNGFREFAYLEI